MVEQEETGQAEPLDDPELLLQARLRLAARRPGVAVAVLQPRPAKLGELAHRLGVLGARIAIPEVTAQIEPQPLGQPRGLRHRLRVLRKAAGHRRRRGQHVAEVAAPLGLRGIERGVQAHRDQRVLQRRAVRRVRMHVSGRHARHSEPLGESLESSIARPIVAQERPLELNSQVVRPEGVEQAPERALVVHAAQRAPAQADQPLGMFEHVGQLSERLRRRSWAAGAGGRVQIPARVCVRARQDPAQVRPAGGILNQQGQVAAVVQVDLGSVDRAQPERPRGDGELHRARHRVVVGQRHRAIAQLERHRHQLVRQRGTIEEREGGMAMKLDVGRGKRRSHTNACSHRPRTLPCSDSMSSSCLADSPGRLSLDSSGCLHVGC